MSMCNFDIFQVVRFVHICTWAKYWKILLFIIQGAKALLSLISFYFVDSLRITS